MLKDSSTYNVDSETIAELIKRKKIHIVFIGTNGLTYLNAFTVNYLGFTSEELDIHVHRVNTKLEAGTLFSQSKCFDSAQ